MPCVNADTQLLRGMDYEEWNLEREIEEYFYLFGIFKKFYSEPNVLVYFKPIAIFIHYRTHRHDLPSPSQMCHL